MIYLGISVVFSVIVGILLKFAKRYHIDVIQAITFNYIMAIGLSLLFFKPELVQWSNAPITLYVSLGILLPVIFICLAYAIKDHGIVKSDIAQRLSLIIPLIASWFLFNESISLFKVVGLITGFAAIWLILNKKQGIEINGKRPIFPIIVFFGFGVIDVLFKQVAKFTSIPYTTSLSVIFAIAFLVSIIYLMIQFITKRRKFQFINLFCGLILGFFNFGNILFYLKAHAVFSGNPSTVFATMNFGVITLGGLIGYYLFKEPLNKLNFIGILLSIVAIGMITISQIYAV